MSDVGGPKTRRKAATSPTSPPGSAAAVPDAGVSPEHPPAKMPPRRRPRRRSSVRGGAATLLFASLLLLAASVPGLLLPRDPCVEASEVCTADGGGGEGGVGSAAAAGPRVGPPPPTEGEGASGAMASASAPPKNVSYAFFYLNCPPLDLPPGDYRVALLYHVDLMNNWADIVRDQMQTLTVCGLGGRASSFAVLVSGGGDAGREELRGVLRYYKPSAEPRLIALDEKGRGKVSSASDLWQTDGAGDSDAETIVFYFRNSGATTYHPDWRTHTIDDEGPYSRSLYWRKYAEWYTLERPHLCARRILDGAKTCGVTDSTIGRHRAEGNRWRYSGEAWVASGRYLVGLPTDGVSDGSIAAGTWIGSDNPHRFPSNEHVQLHRSKKDPSKKLIYPEEYDPAATRFRLACPNWDFPSGDYRVVVGYHVGMLNNWRDVVSDQLTTLERCGLGKRADAILISYANGQKQDILDMVSQYDIAAKPHAFESTKSPWECPINTALRDYCLANGTETDAKPTVVFYFHNKGVSKYRSDWRKYMDLNRKYAKVYYWRKFIEFFTIERPTLCVEAILGGASTCGPAIRAKHHSGNFWTASCQYLSRNPPCDGEGYIASEHWLQKGMGRDNPHALPDVYRQLYRAPPVEMGESGKSLLNLYNHLMQPEEYANLTYFKDDVPIVV